MSTKTLFTVALLLPLLLAACGGGTSVAPISSASALNAYEQALVGDYVLEDFMFIQPGEGGFTAEDFAEYEGSLSLDEDGSARIHMAICEQAGDLTAGCEREFAWRADAGWLYLEAVDGGAGDAWARWESGGMGSLTTEFCVPTNHPECEQILVEDGYEVFTWQRAN